MPPHNQLKYVCREHLYDEDSLRLSSFPIAITVSVVASTSAALSLIPTSSAVSFSAVTSA